MFIEQNELNISLKKSEYETAYSFT